MSRYVLNTRRSTYWEPGPLGSSNRQVPGLCRGRSLLKGGAVCAVEDATAGSALTVILRGDTIAARRTQAFARGAGDGGAGDGVGDGNRTRTVSLGIGQIMPVDAANQATRVTQSVRD